MNDKPVFRKPVAPAAARTNYPGMPQRYSDNYARYRERGGVIEIAEDVEAYAEGRPVVDMPRLAFFFLLFDQIQKERISGDVAELGVYQGRTAVVLARNARRLGRTAWLLDTFAGFDARDLAERDAGVKSAFEDTSISAVRARVGEANTKYIQGFFPDTAAQLPADGCYCLVHIDCDLAAPIRAGLEYFYPRVAPGGFIVVHDYGSLCWPGAEKAIDVFFADKPEGVVPMPDSAGSVVIRKLRNRHGRLTWLQARQLLVPDTWHAAGNDNLVSLLGEGWSTPESWGVWGVGPAHVFRVAPADAANADFTLDLDVSTMLAEGRKTLAVDVVVGGKPTAVWDFTMKENRRVRSLLVRGGTGSDTSVPVTIEMRPHSVVSPRDLDPTKKGTRLLGVALHRIRLRLGPFV